MVLGEAADEAGGVGVAEVVGDFLDLFVGGGEQVRGVFHAFAEEVFVNAAADVLFEHAFEP